jgi:hypothetical protein
MSTPKPPLVGFRFYLGGTERLGWGYLVVVNGQPWLAAREEDTKRDSRLAKMLPLDRRLLEEQPTQPNERKNLSTERFFGNRSKDIKALQKAWVTFNGSRASLERRGGRA